jgi:hypothetical protein
MWRRWTLRTCDAIVHALSAALTVLVKAIKNVRNARVATTLLTERERVCSFYPAIQFHQPLLMH